MHSCIGELDAGLTMSERVNKQDRAVGPGEEPSVVKEMPQHSPPKLGENPSVPPSEPSYSQLARNTCKFGSPGF